MEGRPLEDSELIELAVGGDVRAYEELVRRYRRIAERTAYVITRSATEAEEATQEAFVKAFYALSRFRKDAAFKPWILKIVANEGRNRLRSAGRRAALVVRVGEDRPSGDAAPSPEVALLDDEKREALIRAVNRLPEADREVIACRYFLDLSESETAAVLGCARGTVKSRTSRAMDRLRDRLRTADHASLRPEGAYE